MIKKTLYRVILCLMILSLLPVQAHAIDRIDSSKDVHLTVHFSHEGQPLAGARLQLYKIAEMSGYGEFTLLDEFAVYPVQMTENESDDWEVIANTLNSYALLDGIQPADAGVTDETGTVYFPRIRKPMEPGLYLITGETLTFKGVCYTPAPTLIALPNREGDSHHWDYDVSVNIKYRFRTAPAECTVVKVWEDDGKQADRPRSIEIRLLKDGEVKETVTLSAGNDWSYSWPELEPEYNWTVAEKTVDGYDVSITQDQKKVDNRGTEQLIFTVTNTYDGPGADKLTEEKLPQTGNLWWPVPLLLIAGILFVIAGVIRIRKSRHEA